VDNLEEVGNLKAYVDRSEVVLVFCSAGYTESKNCMIELSHAVVARKPILALLETEDKHSGVTPEQMRRCLVEAEGRFTEWGLDGSPSGTDLAARLLDINECIYWTRLGPMQDVTLRLVAERLLPKGSGVTYLEGEVAQQRTALRPTATGCRHHLFCSNYNQGADALLCEVKTARELKTFSWTTNFDELDDCEAVLVYLDGRTWSSGGTSTAFAAQIEKAMRRGMRLVLAHEMPGGGREERHAVKFETFFQAGQTPRALVAAGIYSTVAVPLMGGSWRETSMALLSEAIAKGLTLNASAPHASVHADAHASRRSGLHSGIAAEPESVRNAARPTWRWRRVRPLPMLKAHAPRSDGGTIVGRLAAARGRRKIGDCRDLSVVSHENRVIPTTIEIGSSVKGAPEGPDQTLITGPAAREDIERSLHRSDTCYV